MKECKIVKIIDDKTVIINGGSDDDIWNCDVFEIYEDGEKVIDPETKENLGTLEKIKDIIEVIDAKEKMSICKKKAKKVDIRNSLYSSDLLYVDQQQISGGLKSENPIKLGDKVRRIHHTSRAS